MRNFISSETKKSDSTITNKIETVCSLKLEYLASPDWIFTFLFFEILYYFFLYFVSISLFKKRKFFYISQKDSETVKIWNSSTFIYKPILIKIYMNADIMNTHREMFLYICKTQFFHEMKYDLEGPMRQILRRVI